MIRKSPQIFGAIGLVSASLSLFSVWNLLQWDFLNWGTQLFLFPFICAICVMGFFSKADPSWSKYLLYGLLLCQVGLYFYVFKFQDPYAPQLLLLLLPTLLAIQVLLAGKFWRRQHGQGLLANKWFIAFCLLTLFALGLETKAALYSELQLLYFGMSLQTLGVFWFFILRLLGSK
ncbi:MAG: hypothetical protein ACKOWW_00245 [Flavobacteriales bacterium]